MRLSFALVQEFLEAELDFARLLVVLRDQALFVDYASNISAGTADGIGLDLFDDFWLWRAFHDILVLVTVVGLVRLKSLDLLSSQQESISVGLAGNSCVLVVH